ncbi:hypothetical protein NSPZN2_100066 [Nitrospira defluvii]|uniref:Uncharacterized protein n=1 Tax=Nitrospira defluvii TaxID=330214 RepID=A0ABM8QZL4_9BACT|nr:hypothetical protein NSPZN2_100066 [Nitrospira defluvii]
MYDLCRLITAHNRTVTAPASLPRTKSSLLCLNGRHQQDSRFSSSFIRLSPIQAIA